jgi:hypothetical protein
LEEFAMASTAQNKLQSEWKEIVGAHPTFARTALTSELILMQAVTEKQSSIKAMMCYMLRESVPLLFRQFWMEQCAGVGKLPPLSGALECLAINQNPSKCISLDDHDWFNDPFHYLPGSPTPGPLPPRR